MGGMLHPQVKGLIDGEIKGLNSHPDSFNPFINDGIEQSNTSKIYKKQYNVGFATGYEKGQKMRHLLDDNTSCKMPLDEKIDHLSFLLEIQQICRENLTQLFLDNITYWEQDQIKKTTINNLETLLLNNKIQRVIDKLILHYRTNFSLKPLKAFYPIYQKLKGLRKEKQKNKNYNLLKGLDELKKELQQWIDYRKT